MQLDAGLTHLFSHIEMLIDAIILHIKVIDIVLIIVSSGTPSYSDYDSSLGGSATSGGHGLIYSCRLLRCALSVPIVYIRLWLSDDAHGHIAWRVSHC